MSEQNSPQVERHQIELLEATLASLDDAVVSTDSLGRISYVNATAEKLTGCSSEDAIGKRLESVCRLISAKTGEPVHELSKKVLRDEELVGSDDESLFIAVDGSSLPVEARASSMRSSDGRIVGHVFVLRDLTERWREASLISEQNRLLERVVRGGSASEILDAICLAVEQHIAADTIATVLLVDETGTHLRPAAGPRCPAEYAAAVDPVSIGADCGSCGTAAYSRQLVIVSDIATDPLWKDFRQAALPHGLRSCWSVPIISSDDSVLGTFAVYSRQSRSPRDQDLHVMEFLSRTAGITIERQRSEEALRNSERRALQANEAKSEFLANMSHEIRTPMAAILGHADLLLSHLKDPDNVSCVSTIRRNGNHLLEIINDILDISRIEAGKLDVTFSSCSLVELLSDLWSMMHVRVEGKPVDLCFDAVGELPEAIQTDPQRLKQVFINLLGNAIKFTESGHVKLRVQMLDHDADPRLQFDVEDTGIGIPEENLKCLFEAFSQGDASVTRKFGGSGLGLAISKRLTEKLGGELTVESTEGVGSTFSVLLPVGSLDSVNFRNIDCDRLSPNLEPSRFEIGLSCRVLLVDDRRDIRFLAQHSLEKAGASVVTAEDGLDAIGSVARATESGEKFDIIIMDMQMPEMDGYTATAKLRSAGCELPIIALTANAMSGDREQCIAAGCDDYLSKPIDTSMLLEKVRCLTQAN
jgi:PAS domain S-box-containing protein